MPGNAIIISLEQDGVAAALLQLDRASRSKALRAVMGAAVAAVMVANFEALDADRHRNEAGKRFYAGAAKSVQRPQVEGDSVVVAVTQEGVAQRYYGGTIVAGAGGTGKKWLPIPNIPAALGRAPGSFSNLKFVFFRGKGNYGPGFGGEDLAALVSEDPKKVRFTRGPKAKKERGVSLVPREDGRLPVVYWLKRSVTQKPDPSVIPEEEKLAAAAYAEGAEYLREAAELERDPAA